MTARALAELEVRPRWGRVAVAMRWLASASAHELAGGGADAVELFLHVPVAEDAVVVGRWLSRAENERRARIQHPRAMADLLAGRRLIRAVFGARLGIGPAEVRLVEGERGALALDPAHGAAWHFNLSHTDGLVVLAVARRPIGVDVEWVARPGRTVELADRYFARAEVAALRALPEAAQRDRFFELWTLKEAYIKARGLGLAIPLGSFAFELGEEIGLTLAPEAGDVPGARWRCALWDVGAEHRVALAIDATL